VGYFHLLMFSFRPESDLQVTSYDRASGSGCHLQIPGRITISLLNLDIADPEHGGLKVTLMPNGNFLVQVPPYGLTENVSTLSSSSLKLMCTVSAAGAGKSVIWCDSLSIVRIRELICWLVLQ
jgi:hypothetical protein